MALSAHAGGKEAIDLLNSSSEFDLLITDVDLPDDVTGPDVAEHWRQLLPGRPVIYTGVACNPYVRLLDPHEIFLVRAVQFQHLAVHYRDDDGRRRVPAVSADPIPPQPPRALARAGRYGGAIHPLLRATAARMVAMDFAELWQSLGPCRQDKPVHLGSSRPARVKVDEHTSPAGSGSAAACHTNSSRSLPGR